MASVTKEGEGSISTLVATPNLPKTPLSEIIMAWVSENPQFQEAQVRKDSGDHHCGYDFPRPLIGLDGKKTAQAWVLSKLGTQDEWLKAQSYITPLHSHVINLEGQRQADTLMSKALGIPVAQSVLFRDVTNVTRLSGNPMIGKTGELKARKIDFLNALISPELLLGDTAPLLLSLARKIDQMTKPEWTEVDKFAQKGILFREGLRNSGSYFGIVPETNEVRALAEHTLAHAAWYSYAEAFQKNLDCYGMYYECRDAIFLAQIAADEIIFHEKVQKDYTFRALPLFTDSEGKPLTISRLGI